MAIRIDGREIAGFLFGELSQKVAELKKKSILPTLAVILVGNDPGSVAYIRQKEKASQKIGARFRLNSLPINATEEEVQSIIEKHNTSHDVHGIIVQLPLPAHINSEKIVGRIHPNKDVDGFLPDSPFIQPVANAVLTILQFTSRTVLGEWLQSRNICVLGRGKTAGQPITAALEKRGVPVNVIHSQTPNPKELLKKADIVISCVGKPQVINSNDIREGVIVIGVGLHMEDGKLRGDYNEEDIATKASYYTPTPGGVGPVNVACLWENVIRSAQVSQV